MWHLVFSKKKLSAAAHNKLQYILDDASYTCGASLENLHLPESLQGVVFMIIVVKTLSNDYTSQLAMRTFASSVLPHAIWLKISHPLYILYVPVAIGTRALFRKGGQK